jgi:hypothetical protein
MAGWTPIEATEEERQALRTRLETSVRKAVANCAEDFGYWGFFAYGGTIRDYTLEVALFTQKQPTGRH